MAREVKTLAEGGDSRWLEVRARWELSNMLISGSTVEGKPYLIFLRSSLVRLGPPEDSKNVKIGEVILLAALRGWSIESLS